MFKCGGLVPVNHGFSTCKSWVSISYAIKNKNKIRIPKVKYLVVVQQLVCEKIIK